MRSFALLRSFLAATVLIAAIGLGTWLFHSYWGDVRRVAAYELVRESRAVQDAERVWILEEALTLDSDNWLAALRLGEEHLFLNELDEAQRLLDIAVRANPQSPFANYTMGIVQFRLGSVEAALPYFETAAVLDPGNLQYEGMVKQLRDVLSGAAAPSDSFPGVFHGDGAENPADDSGEDSP